MSINRMNAWKTITPGRRRTAVACALLALLAGAPAARAETLVLPLAMDRMFWKYTGDRFRCELELSLHEFGHLAFVKPAGGELRLEFRSLLREGEAVWVSPLAPPWQPQAPEIRLPMERQADGLVLASDGAARMLSMLTQGYWLRLHLDPLELQVPTLNWGRHAKAFEQCEEQLSPLSVEQARDWVLFYRRGQRALSAEQLEELKRVARYIRHDPKVSRVLIDSYTDNTGSRLGNLVLSRERAADVAAALRDFGVPAHLLEQRAHGERYPSTTNDSEEGRDLNRRVTLRIIRQGGKDKI